MTDTHLIETLICLVFYFFLQKFEYLYQSSWSLLIGSFRLTTAITGTWVAAYFYVFFYAWMCGIYLIKLFSLFVLQSLCCLFSYFMSLVFSTFYGEPFYCPSVLAAADGECLWKEEVSQIVLPLKTNWKLKAHSTSSPAATSCPHSAVNPL